MAWQTLRYKLTSSAPLLMKNGQTADPLNKWSKSLKKISQKKTKTDADFEEMAHIEFMGALYLSESGPIIPNYVIDAMIVTAAKRRKEGNMAKAGVYAINHATLEYDGPRTAAELWADEKFRHTAGVRVGMNRVSRTRPIFREWSCVIEINIEPSLVNPSTVDEWMQIAGPQIGLCDWRPQYGRFTAVRLNDK